MRGVVRTRWKEYTGPLEGPAVPCLYNDIRGKTTIAWGNLVDSVAAVVGLPFVWPDGRRATAAEIAAAWQSVHNDRQAAIRGWTYAATLTPLRLTPEGIEGLVWGRLDSNDRILSARVPDWEDKPACAQMALHSLAWACGANAHFPRMFQAVADGDYETAAIESHMNEWTPEGIHNKGLIPRNVAQKTLLRNAGRVRDFHLDPDLIDWTHDLSVSGAPTQPSPLAEEVTGSGGIVHVSRYEPEPDE